MNKFHEGHRLFHSFCISPGSRFDGQNKSEVVILRLRAHPITQLYWFVNTVLLALTLFLINLLLPNFLDAGQIIFYNIFSAAIVFGYFWFNFIVWFFNVGIITNERVIDVDISDILYKEVTMALLDKVEDVTSKTGGFFSSIFDYGNVFVQTAGTEANVEYIDVPRPSAAVKIINDLIHK